VTIVRVGATEKYSVGWESAFGKGKPKSVKPAAAKTKTKHSASKAVSTKKAAGKKKSKKKH
jgi:hypothetical protein